MSKELDLSDEVTVFLITVGEPTTADAEVAVLKQDCDFNFRRIENVAPMSAAFQQMIDTCQTRYYVQVDADMLLKPDAVTRLWQEMKEQQKIDPRVAMVAMSLYDGHLGMPIIGCKIYDHEAMADAPYRDVQSCEVDQIDRLVEEGWKVVSLLADPGDIGATVGYHVTAQTPWQAFERYRDLAEKHRRWGHSPWVEKLMQKFLLRFRDLGGQPATDRDVWAVLGLAVGCATDVSKPAGEKDARKYHSDPVYLTLKRFLEDA